MQCKMYRVVAQCCEKCEGILSMFSEKMEQVRTAYQKMGKSCQMMEQERENLTKYKQELQEKFSEKSRSVKLNIRFVSLVLFLILNAALVKNYIYFV